MLKKEPFVAIKEILQKPASEPKSIRHYKEFPEIWTSGAIFVETLSCTYQITYEIEHDMKYHMMRSKFHNFQMILKCYL